MIDLFAELAGRRLRRGRIAVEAFDCVLPNHVRGRGDERGPPEPVAALPHAPPTARPSAVTPPLPERPPLPAGEG